MKLQLDIDMFETDEKDCLNQILALVKAINDLSDDKDPLFNGTLRHWRVDA